MIEQDSIQETKIRQYLLGELTFEEQILVEQRLFLESEYAEMAQVVEDDLVDDYLHDDLTTSERTKFEHHFLGQPEHRANLKIARALEKYLAAEAIGAQSKAPFTSQREHSSVLVPFFRRQPVVWVAMAATLLIVLSIVTWKALQSRRSEEQQAKDSLPAKTSDQPPPAGSPSEKKEEEERSAERQGGDSGSSEEPTKKETGNQSDRERPATTFASFQILPGGLSRSVGQANIVRITPSLQSVVLNLPLDITEPYDRYQYEFLSGRHLVDKGNLELETDVSGPIVSITLPAKLLTRESYEIRLRGVSAGGRSSAPSTYHFKVERAR